MLPVVSVNISSVSLPVNDYRGYGTSIPVVGDGPRVVLSWLSGPASFRCGFIDVAAGKRSDGVPIRGEVRDLLMDSATEGWLLSSYALSRVRVDHDEPVVTSAARPKGIGKFLGRLLPVGAAHIAVGAWWSHTTAILERSTAAIVRRLRITGPELTCERSDSTRLLAPHGGQYVDLYPSTLTVLRRGVLPEGTTPVAHRSELFLLAGPREGRGGGISTEKLWDIRPERLVVLDRDSLAVIRSVPAPDDTRTVLGVDHAGRLVLATRDGVALVDRETLTELDRASIGRQAGPATFVPAAGCVALMPYRPPLDRLFIVRWDR